MSGDPKGKGEDDASRGIDGMMVNHRGTAKDVVLGKGRSDIDYSMGMQGVVSSVRNILKDKFLSLPYREGFLKFLDRIPKEKFGDFFYTYQWRFKVNFEEDIQLAIQEGKLSKDIKSKLPNLFPEVAERERILKNLASARENYKKTLQQKKDLFGMELFFAWVLDNWDYLWRMSYTHKGTPLEDGLFFYEPKIPVKSEEDLKKYLGKLYVECDASIRRTTQYTGVSGGVNPNAATPTISYQQLLRWIALDSQTSVRGKRLSSYKEYQLLTVFPEALKELTRRINLNLYNRIQNGVLVTWKKEEIWQVIYRHLADHNIPQVQVKVY